MRDIMNTSLSTTEHLRKRAHNERKAASPQQQHNYKHKHKHKHKQLSSKNTPNPKAVFGQEHLLFQNHRSAFEKYMLLEDNNNNNNNNSGHNAAHTTAHRSKGRNHRKIAESFEAERRNKNTDHKNQNKNQHAGGRHCPFAVVDTNANASANASRESAAALEDFEVALAKRISSECATRLWIRRRPLLQHKRGIRKRQPQRRQQHDSNNDPEVLMLEPGDCYQNNTTTRNIPDPSRSTHIYAIRYSSDDHDDTRETGVTVSSDSGVLFDTARGSNSNSNRHHTFPGDGNPTRTTESNANANANTNAKSNANTNAHRSLDCQSMRFVATTATAIVDDAGPLEYEDEDEAAFSTAGMFGPIRMALPPKREVLGWTTVSEKHSIHVVDVGLTQAECDALVITTEEACNGRYAAYTYAKQTLGCREYPNLSKAAMGPVHSIVAAILRKFEGSEIVPPGMRHQTMTPSTINNNNNLAANDGGGDASPGGANAGTTKQKKKNSTHTTDTTTAPAFRTARAARVLQLDDREPHIVKYDVTKKERQKLDMHTDKSEWTFLIALSNGCGLDYEGGGTYFECLDATVHVQKGHALVFPGRLRHRGQSIHHGLRFLLVGFLIDKQEGSAAKTGKTTVANANAPANAKQRVVPSNPTPKSSTNTDATSSFCGTPISDDLDLAEVVRILAPTVAAT